MHYCDDASEGASQGELFRLCFISASDVKKCRRSGEYPMVEDIPVSRTKMAPMIMVVPPGFELEVYMCVTTCYAKRDVYSDFKPPI